MAAISVSSSDTEADAEVMPVLDAEVISVVSSPHSELDSGSTTPSEYALFHAEGPQAVVEYKQKIRHRAAWVALRTACRRATTAIYTWREYCRVRAILHAWLGQEPKHLVHMICEYL